MPSDLAFEGTVMLCQSKPLFLLPWLAIWIFFLQLEELFFCLIKVFLLCMLYLDLGQVLIFLHLHVLKKPSWARRLSIFPSLKEAYPLLHSELTSRLDILPFLYSAFQNELPPLIPFLNTRGYVLSPNARTRY